MNSNFRRIKCEHCKNKVLRIEASCISCFICGWVKYFRSDKHQLLQQVVMNGQYRGYNRATALRGVYHIINQFMSEGKDFSLTLDEQRNFRPTLCTTPESIFTKVVRI